MKSRIETVTMVAFSIFMAVSIIATASCRKNSRLLLSVPDADGWQRGEYVTLRRSHYHAGCGGQWLYRGQVERAGMSDTDRFFLHTCDKCGATNKVLNAQWPEHKREWRPTCE